MSQQTLVNGNRYSFVNVSLSSSSASSGGADYDVPQGVLTAINYDATQEPGVVQGNAVVVTGLTQGYGQGSGNFEMLVSEWDDFVAQITANGVYPVMAVDFDWVVSYSVNDVDVRTDVLRGCRITKVGSPQQKGSDGIVRNCEMFIRRIVQNGVDMFADPSV